MKATLELKFLEQCPFPELEIGDAIFLRGSALNAIYGKDFLKALGDQFEVIGFAAFSAIRIKSPQGKEFRISYDDIYKIIKPTKSKSD